MSTIDPNQTVEWGGGCATPHDTTAGYTDRLIRLASRIHNGIWERRLGIDTRGVQAIDHPDGVYYGALSYARTRRVLRELELTAADTFVDIGVGKGRVTTLAAKYTDADVVGVDVDHHLCAIAQANALKLGLGHRVRIVCAAGEDFDYTGTNVFFMFTPFGAATLDKVLARIRGDLDRPVRMVFVNCNDFHLAVFRTHTWLREVRIRWDGPMRVAYFETA